MKGRVVVSNGPGKPFEIREYPVGDPGPGEILIKITLACVCGSDLHMWRVRRRRSAAARAGQVPRAIIAISN